MIIGGHNLIIGTIFTVINEKSKSIFFYIIEQINYILHFSTQIYLIIPKSASPPLNFFNKYNK